MIDDILLVHPAALYNLYYLVCVELSGKSGLLQLRHEACIAWPFHLYSRLSHGPSSVYPLAALSALLLGA
jgi:hypothetical protein